MTFKTPVALIGVRGTEFAVEVAKSGATIVSVIHGSIWMRARDDGSHAVGPATHTVSVPSSGMGISLQRGLRATGHHAVDSKISAGLRTQGMKLSKTPARQRGKAGGKGRGGKAGGRRGRGRGGKPGGGGMGPPGGDMGPPGGGMGPPQ